jgi:N-methylhydantoinase A/oxoprolinase/acetone carboxylase beta subunit
MNGGTVVAVHRRSTHRWRWVVLAGVLAGLTCLTRANALVLLLPLGLAVWTVRPRFSVRALAAPALLVVLALVTISPWTIRNAVTFHRFIPVSTQLGSALAGAQLEFVVCRLRAKALTPQPKLVRVRTRSARIPKDAVRKKRDIYWPDLGKRRATPVYDGERLANGNRIAGPAIVETADTTVVVQPGTRLRVDELGNFELSF